MTNDKIKKIDSLLYTHRIALLSKAAWKTAEKEWADWITDYNISINEHLILMTIQSLGKTTISDVSRFGIMHVSTVYNFAKNLEKKELIKLEKDPSDKRNTYLYITDKGLELIDEILSLYEIETNLIYNAAESYKEELYSYPSYNDLTYLVGKIHGKPFLDSIEKSHNQIRKHLLDKK
ncbi:HTH-type transcriptional regulator Hpr [Staphylococcus massiliensis]|uniref:Transcriptional regulator Hpr n=1 Tax=Staphylococcus massiliensis S46 TaxID=1229783 RepID=K9AYI1_9STAP|nr:HTH-type transcriptional regulator Hpr [Staphylococcus massiliensis]EKU46575.1 transcriptional regulator Hpr [Staphylococcus massiliensis S46]MCG3399660.1 HTH-type transcriptional regulator Hpr [Staphylococcus massiliensis]MCG3400764.1 HTH-type transcriptional regulator Hpr [Staphylococcus massiliensis]PNZ99064.1 transcriptional regulator [Staphylococcus massiliensis CCUG 55927]